MPAKEIKVALKEIREAIKNRENQIAIRKCDEVLLEEPANYMALVLMGAAYQEKDKKEAAKYLRRAVDCSPTDPIVALQGLANCANIEELPEIYEKLLKFISEKFKEYHAKILNISSHIEIQEKCIEVLIKETLLEDIEKNKERIESALNVLGKIICKLSEIPEKWQNMIIPSLEISIKDSEDPQLQCECYKRYLKQLYKLGQYEKLLIIASTMANLFPKEIYPLEWVCKIYSEHQSEINSVDILNEPMEFYVNNLLILSTSSVAGLISKSMLYYDQEQYVLARDIIENIKTKSNTTMELLGNIYMKIGAYKLATNIWVQLKKQNLDLAICLSYSNDAKSLNEALNILNKIKPNTENQIDILITTGRINFNLNCKAGVFEIFKKLHSIDEEYSNIFGIEFLKSSTESLELLDKLSSSEYEVEILKGKIYLQEKQFEKSLINFVKATKLKPYRSECFLNLGLLYYNLNDIARAKKCFEKSVDLNPLGETAVTYLCAIYRKNEEWDLNEALLNKIISKVSGSQQRFALFQFGLHFTALEKFNEAIDSFRTALRYDIDNILYWESLADTYQERGSFQSAMRVYQKILEIDSENSYAKLQIGNLKTTLRMYSCAIEDFNSLLSESPNNIPALKGAAEANYYLANSLMTEHLMGRARDHFQTAINLLQRVFLLKKTNMIWLWRLTANIFTQVANHYPIAQSKIDVLGKLAGHNSEIITLNKTDLFNFAIRYYTYALKLNPDDILLWHELSICSYYYATIPNQSEDNVKKYMELAKNCCMTSIKNETFRWQSWNHLGVLFATKIQGHEPNYALAQNYFIKALNVEKNSAMSWTNLGVLYLNVNEIKLANQAFIRAQQSDPTYLNCWIGQAFLAETIGEEEEAMDLFRHCTEVAFNVESAIGYAHWVSKTLSDSIKMEMPQYRYAIEDMHALSKSLDQITWCLSAEDENCSVETLTYFGYLNARFSLWNPAINAFNLALSKASDKQKDMILFNLGYCFMMQKCPEKAIESFSSIVETTLKSSIGLASAYSQAKRYEESFATYNSTLDWLATTEKEKAFILVAMAAMYYLFEGEENTKMILYQCLGLTERPMQALYSACATGILHKDIPLTDTILEELNKYKHNTNYCSHIAFLTAQIYMLKNQPKAALMYLLKMLHIHPNLVLLRKVVVNFIIHNFNTASKLSLAACRIAQNCIISGHINSKKINCTDDAKTLLNSAQAIKNFDKIKHKKIIQKAIHLNPALPECIIALKSII